MPAQGFSEQNLKDFAEGLKPTSIPAPPPYYIVGEGPNVTPEVWFNATQVWEVKAADLSISPVHRAATGLVDASKGIALRFPRLLRVRDDKKPEDATTSTQARLRARRQRLALCVL
jgi:DNA ligase-1